MGLLNCQTGLREDCWVCEWLMPRVCCPDAILQRLRCFDPPEVLKTKVMECCAAGVRYVLKKAVLSSSFPHVDRAEFLGNPRACFHRNKLLAAHGQDWLELSKVPPPSPALTGVSDGGGIETKRRIIGRSASALWAKELHENLSLPLLGLGSV